SDCYSKVGGRRLERDIASKTHGTINAPHKTGKTCSGNVTPAWTLRAIVTQARIAASIVQFSLPPPSGTTSAIGITSARPSRNSLFMG
ncbi:hypothetical protein, partial [Xanthomonas translucens]